MLKIVNFNVAFLAERTTLEPVSHELGAQYSMHPNLTELGTEMPPTSISQLRKGLHKHLPYVWKNIYTRKILQKFPMSHRLWHFSKKLLKISKNMQKKSTTSFKISTMQEKHTGGHKNNTFFRNYQILLFLGLKIRPKRRVK